MSWQEELRRLDAQLTAGALTEAEHRRKRDEVIAEASGDAGPSTHLGTSGATGDGTQPDASGDTSGDASQQGAAPPPTAPPPTAPPATAPGAQPPQHDGPTWAAANPAAAAQLPAGSDAADVQPGTFTPAASQPASTKPAPTPLGHAPSTARRAPAPLFVPHTPANGSAGAFGSGGALGSGGAFGSGGAAPATGTSPTDDTSAAAQASAYPDFSAPPKKRKVAWLVVPLVILVVLGGVIAGTWWLGNSGGGEAAPAPTSGALADPDGGSDDSGDPGDDEIPLGERLPELPGEPSPDNSTMSIDRALDLGFITEVDAESMRKFGVADLIYRASAAGENGNQGHSLVVARTPSSQKAVGLQHAMNTTLVKEGFANERLHDDPRFISFTGRQAGGRVSIVWYASGDRTVGIGVSQPVDGDEGKLIRRLEETLTSMQDALPAS